MYHELYPPMVAIGIGDCRLYQRIDAPRNVLPGRGTIAGRSASDIFVAVSVTAEFGGGSKTTIRLCASGAHWYSRSK